MSQEFKLELIGKKKMSCGGCEQTVEFALSQNEGVNSVKADYKTQTIEIELVDNTDVKEIQKELSLLAYETRLL